MKVIARTNIETTIGKVNPNPYGIVKTNKPKSELINNIINIAKASER